MAYFSGFIDISFKKDEKGRTIFYPWGIFGRGYILPDDKKDIIHKKLKRSYQVLLTLVILTEIFLSSWVSIILVLLLLGVLAIFDKRLVRGCEISPDRLTLSDTRSTLVRSQSLITTWFLEICSLLFVLAGIFILVTSPKQWFIGILSVSFFGFCAYIFWDIIRAKKEMTERTHNESLHRIADKPGSR